MTGLFTIALVVAAVLAGIWFNRDRVQRVPYQIATTQSIPGLNPQAAVRYRGLEVGKVDNIDFDPKISGQILIGLAIDPDAPITTTTFATLGYQGVTGIAFIQLDDDKTGSPRVSSSAGHTARIPLRPGFLDQLEKRGTIILDKAEALTTRMNQLASPANQKIILGAFEDVSKTAVAYRALPEQLQPALARLPELAGKAEQSMAALNTLSASATRMTDHIDQIATGLQGPNGAITRLNTTVDRVGGSLEAVTSDLELQTLPHVVAMTDEARTSLRALKRTATVLSDRPQSLLFGAPNTAPGPGEPGFVAPTK